MGTLIATLAGAIYTFLRFYQIALILRLYLTWFPNLNIYSQPFFTLVKLTNPYLRIWRGVMPPVGALDFSPIMGFMIISFMEDMLPDKRIEDALNKQYANLAVIYIMEKNLIGFFYTIIKYRCMIPVLSRLYIKIKSVLF